MRIGFLYDDKYEDAEILTHLTMYTVKPPAVADKDTLQLFIKNILRARGEQCPMGRYVVQYNDWKAWYTRYDIKM